MAYKKVNTSRRVWHLQKNTDSDWQHSKSPLLNNLYINEYVQIWVSLSIWKNGDTSTTILKNIFTFIKGKTDLHRAEVSFTQANATKGIEWHFEKYAYLLSCWELNDVWYQLSYLILCKSSTCPLMSVAVVKAIIKYVDSGSVWLTTFKAQEFTEGNLVALCLHCMQYHSIAKIHFSCTAGNGKEVVAVQ